MMIVAINRENKVKQVSIPVGTIGLENGVILKGLIGNVSTRVVNGEAVLSLPAQSAIALGSF